MSQDTVNNYAQKKFEELRRKMQLDIQKPIVQKAIILTQEKIDEMSDVSEAQDIFNNNCNEAVIKANEIDRTFSFIEGLKLPPKLSLAIGLIISGHKTGNTQDLLKSIDAIREALNGE